jgi:hypothetical protein
MIDLHVALSMVGLADTAPDPLQQYMCYWIAFNNIYRMIAEEVIPEMRSYETNPDGTVKLKQRQGQTIWLPEMKHVQEWKQIREARLRFNNTLKHRLIRHRSTQYFVTRIPRWYDEPIEYDSKGQKLNGVLKVGKTLSRDYPVWSPIDEQLYTRFLEGNRSETTVDTLVRQIVDLLYTVRNNLFHGGKSFDDAHDHEVLDNALPLLTMIVESFMWRD